MSYIIIDKQTGKARAEIFSKSLLKHINREKYEVKTALQHLQDFNRAVQSQKQGA